MNLAIDFFLEVLGPLPGWLFFFFSKVLGSFPWLFISIDFVAKAPHFPFHKSRRGDRDHYLCCRIVSSCCRLPTSGLFSSSWSNSPPSPRLRLQLGTRKDRKEKQTEPPGGAGGPHTRPDDFLCSSSHSPARSVAATCRLPSWHLVHCFAGTGCCGMPYTSRISPWMMDNCCACAANIALPPSRCLVDLHPLATLQASLPVHSSLYAYSFPTLHQSVLQTLQLSRHLLCLFMFWQHVVPSLFNLRKLLLPVFLKNILTRLIRALDTFHSPHVLGDVPVWSPCVFSLSSR